MERVMPAYTTNCCYSTGNQSRAVKVSSTCFPLFFRRVIEIFYNNFSFSLGWLSFKRYWIYTFKLYMLKDKRQLIVGLEEIDQKAFINCLLFLQWHWQWLKTFLWFWVPAQHTANSEQTICSFRFYKVSSQKTDLLPCIFNILQVLQL